MRGHLHRHRQRLLEPLPEDVRGQREEWLAANDATADTPLYVGDELCIPAGAHRPGAAAATDQPPATTGHRPPTPGRRPRRPAAGRRPLRLPSSPPPHRRRPAHRRPVAPRRPPPADPAEVEAIIREIWPDELEERALSIATPRERPAARRPQLLLLRRVRDLLRDGPQLPGRARHHVGASSCSTPARTSRPRTTCTRSPAGSPGRRPTPADRPTRVPFGRRPRRLAARTHCARSSMDRASDYGSEGWEFDSLRARQLDMAIRQVSPSPPEYVWSGEWSPLQPRSGRRRGWLR